MAILTKIRSSNIADSAITTTKIAVDAVTAGKIVAGAVAADVGTGGITTALIADSTGAADGVTAAKIATNAVTFAKIEDAAGLAASHHKIPSVSTANLPGSGTNVSVTPTDGMMVYNTTLGLLQQRAAGIWSAITTAPVLTSFVYSDGATATAEKTVVGLVTIACGTTISTTVTVAGDTLGIQVGMVVAGVGIPVGATVVSVTENTSFVLSAAATIIDTDVDLTFGGAVTITGSNFDSILGGNPANIAVTFDGTSATSISVNPYQTIITCTPPAHAAGTITLLLTNASGLTASTDFVYDIEPIFTTATGSLGNFADGAYTDDHASSPRIQGTENSVALTTGFERVTSASDDTVITTTIQGLTVLTSGYLTGTLSATVGTTYPFYATAKDSQNQRTAPRLFNIISVGGGEGGLLYTGQANFRVHIFGDTSPPAAQGTTVVVFTVHIALTADILIVAGGGGGSAGPTNLGPGGSGGGAGGMLVLASQSLAAGTYNITVGGGGSGGVYNGGGAANAANAPWGRQGVNSSVINNSAASYSKIAYGGGHGTNENVQNTLMATQHGGSGGGTSHTGTVSLGRGTYSGSLGGGVYDSTPRQGYDGGLGTGSGGDQGAGGGGGSSGPAQSSHKGGDGTANLYRLGTPVTYAGGGGGGVYTDPSGAGGDGGGGAGNSGGHGYAGTNKLGGGGGGGGDNGYSGGQGGSGIVIIRYAV